MMPAYIDNMHMGGMQHLCSYDHFRFYFLLRLHDYASPGR